MEKQPMDPEDRRRRVEAVLEELSPYAREHLVQLVSLGDRCSQMFDELGPGQNALMELTRSDLAIIVHYTGKGARRTAPRVFAEWNR